jgi:hypothetical protein
MPRPVLSETTYNSSDIATAILNQADLSVTNQDLGVIDITNKFTLESGISGDTTNDKAFHFNGFVFMNFNLTAQNITNVTSFDIMTINDSDFYPSTVYRTNSVSFQQDSVNAILIQTNGNIQANSVYVPSGGDASFRININCWYRI